MSISVVIPCLDGADFLGATLVALRNQQRPPDEVIVADNGSSDGSQDIARSFDGVELLDVARRGAANARIAGAVRATGDMLMFLDADDLISPDALGALEAQLKAGLQDGSGNIACCPWYRYELADEAWHAFPASCPPRRPGQDDLAAWLTGWYHPPCSLLWSRDAYERSGGWDGDIGVNDDGDVMMRGLIAGNRLCVSRDGSAFYRRLPDGQASLSSHGSTAGGVASRMRVLRRVADRIDQAGRTERYAAALAEAFAAVARDGAQTAPALADEAAASAGRFRDRSGWTGIAARRLARAAATARDRVSKKIRLAPGGEDRTGRIVGPLESEKTVPIRWPLVSIVMPAFNRETTIQRSIRSVLAQDYPNFELCVVDDASTDGTVDRIAAIDDRRLRLIRQPRNRGAAAARNRGIDVARGDYIALIDSDDEWLAGKLRKQVCAMEGADRSVGMLVSAIETVGARGKTVYHPEHGGWIHDVLLVRNVLHGATNTALIRREVFDLTGGFDTSLPAIEDWDLWIRIARFFRIARFDRLVARYHDADLRSEGGDVRLSRDTDRNRRARAMLFERHLPSMQRNGVDHLFLLESAERELSRAGGRKGLGAVMTLKAIARRPVAKYPYRWLATRLPRQLLGRTLS